MADGPGAAAAALPSGCSFDVTRDASGFQLLGEAPISEEKENPYGIARGVALIAIILKATSLQLPSGYPELLAELSTRIRSAQLRAVSRELVLLYWSIGREARSHKSSRRLEPACKLLPELQGRAATVSECYAEQPREQ
jgi:hypothetical protein